MQRQPDEETTSKQPVSQLEAGTASTTSVVNVAVAMPQLETGKRDVSFLAQSEGAVDQQQPLMVASGIPAHDSPQQQQLADISQDADADPMQESLHALRQALAAEDAARKEVKEALQLVRIRRAELAKEEQRKAQEEAEELARQSRRSSMGGRAQPLLYGTTKVAAAWEPELPNMEETQDLSQQLEDLAQQQWATEVQPPKVQDAVHEAPAQQLRPQTKQAPNTAMRPSEDLSQQLQELGITNVENSPVTHNKFVGAQPRRGDDSMASTGPPCSERGGPKTPARIRRKSAPRKADGKGNGRVLRQKAKPVAHRAGGINTPLAESARQARHAHTVVLESSQISPVPFSCQCQEWPKS